MKKIASIISMLLFVYPISSFPEDQAVVGLISEVTLERTMCFGHCPVYKVILRRDGLATYVGEKYVKLEGIYRGRVEPYDFAKLAKLIESLGFFRLNESYTESVTDLPSAITTVVHGSRQKTVVNYGNAGPIELWGIEMIIDAFVSGIEWEKIEVIDRETAMELANSYVWRFYQDDPQLKRGLKPSQVTEETGSWRIIYEDETVTRLPAGLNVVVDKKTGEIWHRDQE